MNESFAPLFLSSLECFDANFYFCYAFNHETLYTVYK